MGLASLLLISLFGMSLAQPNENQKMNGPQDGMGPQDAKMMSPQSMGFPMSDPLEISKPIENHKMDEPRDGMGPQDLRMMQPQNAGFPMGVPLEVLFSGHGFALVDNESHILRLKVESIMPLEPDQIRDLLASNKSLEEIRDDILAKEGEKTNRGSMILDRSIYPLINIVVSNLGNNSTLMKADLADSSPSNTTDTAILGSISMIISPSDGTMIGKGELRIEQGLPATRYSLLIDMDPSRHGQEKRMREMSQ
jgi:hypothetical protein